MINIKNFEKENVKYFLNDKFLYIEHSTPELKLILDVELLYKVDAYESKFEFLKDYISIILKKDKDSLNWKSIGNY